jgi:hypothetical protein
VSEGVSHAKVVVPTGVEYIPQEPLEEELEEDPYALPSGVPLWLVWLVDDPC